jgi:uncharacterized repeat protein (TIGR03803 family)
MSVEDARAALAGLEGKLSDALDRRDKIIVETVRTSDKAFAGDQSARNSLGPLNKQAKAIDSEIALLQSLWHDSPTAERRDRAWCSSSRRAGTETVLHSFTGSDGATLQPGLIADSSGDLYGMTTQGGASGQGVVFKLAPAGTFRVLYSFCGLGLPCSDGAQPFAGLFADGSGNLYGTTIGGGSGTACQGSPCGVVFKLTDTGFCTAPFSAFNAKLAIYYGPNPNQDAFGLLGSFTLASSSDGINPVTEPVTHQVGGFTAEIPPNSFTQSPLGTYSFIGTINGVDMEVVIQPIGGKQFAVEAAALNTNLTGTANPVTIKLSIDDDSGTTPVNAVIF